MMIAVSIFIVGSALQAGAQNSDYIFAGRFIAGWAIGMLSHVVPMYQSEISPPEIRGSLVSLQQFSITVGILVSFWVSAQFISRLGSFVSLIGHWQLDYGFHFIGIYSEFSTFTFSVINLNCRWNNLQSLGPFRIYRSHW